MKQEKKLEAEKNTKKTAEEVAEEILLQNEIDKAEVLELSQKLFVLKSQIEQETALLTSAKEESGRINTELRKIREEAKTEAKEIVQKAQDEASTIVKQSKADAAEITSHAKQLLEDNTKSIRLQQEQMNKRESDIIKKEKEILKKETELQDKEANAQIGFAKQFEGEKDKSKKEIENLKLEIELLQKKKIETKSQIDEETDKYKAAKLKEIEEALQKERDQFKQAVEANNKKTISLEQRESQLDELQSNLEREKEFLSGKKQSLKEFESSIDGKVNALVEEKHQSLLVELQTKKETLNNLMGKLQTISRERDDLAIRIGQSRFVDVDNLKLQIDQLKSDLETAKKEAERYKHQILDNGMSKNTIESYKAKASDYDDLQQKYNSACRQLEQIKLELAKKNNDSEMLVLQMGYNAQLKATADELTKELERKKIVARSERLESITKELPYLKTIDELHSFEEEAEDLLNEQKWLDYIQKQSELSGIVFSKRLLNAYHTSLKIGEWSPLVVLAGVSGTGKSELPRQYALHGGMNFLAVPVKPDWDSPQSLFGYYNSIENKFEPTELLRALYQMQPEINKKNLRQEEEAVHRSNTR